jgi:DNA-binding MurR/RpiR family transcriptional regulator
MIKQMSKGRPHVYAAKCGDLIEELRLHFDGLTDSQKRIAEYVVEHVETVAFSTLDQMAAHLDVNPSTIVRFTYRLGLAGFPDLQERMRELVREQLSRNGDPIHEGHIAHLEGTRLGASFSNDWQNLHRTISGIDAAAFDRAADMIVHAGRVYVVADSSALPVAQYFAPVLNRMRSGVWLGASQDAHAMTPLAKITPEDCVLAFTFPPYASTVHRAVLWAKQNKAKIIAVSGSRISAVGQIADAVLLASSANMGAKPSMVAPMAIANALLNTISEALGSTTEERSAVHDRLVHSWETFINKTDGAVRVAQ